MAAGVPLGAPTPFAPGPPAAATSSLSRASATPTPAAAASRTAAAAKVSAAASSRVVALTGGPLRKSSLDLVLGVLGGAVLLALLVWAVVQPPRTETRRRHR